MRILALWNTEDREEFDAVGTIVETYEEEHHSFEPPVMKPPAEDVIRLDELSKVFALISGNPNCEDAIPVLIERAAARVAPDLDHALQRKVLALVALYGDVEESQIAWVIARQDRVIDIREAIDALIASGRLRRRGLVSLTLPQGSSFASSSSDSTSG